MELVTSTKEKTKLRTDHQDHVSSTISPGATARIATDDKNPDSKDAISSAMPIKTEDSVLNTSSKGMDSNLESLPKSGAPSDIATAQTALPIVISPSYSDNKTQCDAISGTDPDSNSSPTKDVDEKSDGGGSTASDTVSSTQAAASMVGKMCVVCNDKALSCNFGAITCESCKAFFRRNAHKDFSAKCDKTCAVTVETRSYCKKCRLQKCFDMGMKMNLILTDDQKRKRKQKILENKIRRMGHMDSGHYPQLGMPPGCDYYEGELHGMSGEHGMQGYPHPHALQMPNERMAMHRGPPQPAGPYPPYTHLESPPVPHQLQNMGMPSLVPNMAAAGAHLSSPPVNMTAAGAHLSSAPVNMAAAGAHLSSAPVHMAAAGAHLSSAPVNMAAAGAHLSSPPVNMAVPGAQLPSPPANMAATGVSQPSPPAGMTLPSIDNITKGLEAPNVPPTRTVVEATQSALSQSTYILQAPPPAPLNVSPSASTSTLGSHMAGNSAAAPSNLHSGFNVQPPPPHQTAAQYSNLVSGYPEAVAPPAQPPPVANASPVSMATPNTDTGLYATAIPLQQGMGTAPNMPDADTLQETEIGLPSVDSLELRRTAKRSHDNRSRDPLAYRSTSEGSPSDVCSSPSESDATSDNEGPLPSSSDISNGALLSTTLKVIRDAKMFQTKISDLPPPIPKPSFAAVFEDPIFKTSEPLFVEVGEQLRGACMAAYDKLPENKCPSNPSYVQMFNFGEDAIRQLVILAKNLPPFQDLGRDDQICLLKASVLHMMVLKSALSYDPVMQGWRVKDKSGERVVLPSAVRASQDGRVLMNHYGIITISVLVASGRDIIVIALLIVLSLLSAGNVKESDELSESHKVREAHALYLEFMRSYVALKYPGKTSMFQDLLNSLDIVRDFSDTYINAMLKSPLSQLNPLLLEINNIMST